MYPATAAVPVPLAELEAVMLGNGAALISRVADAVAG